MIEPNKTLVNRMQRGTKGSILWLTGWSMPETVFGRLHSLLPEFDHVSVDYSRACTPEEIFELAERAARNARNDLPHKIGGGHQATALRRPLLIAGWSLGGLLALRLAVQGLADGLLLLAATACFTRSKEQLDRGWPDAYVRQMIASIMKDRQTAEFNFRRTLFTDAEWEAGLGAKLPQAGSWSTSALIAGLHVLRSEDYRTQIPEITCPVLLAHGLEDKICPYGAAKELLAQMPQAKLIAIAGCGHAPFLKKEKDMAEAIRGWWHGQSPAYNSTSI